MHGTTWFRVFCGEKLIEADALRSYLPGVVLFRGDEAGWFEAVWDRDLTRYELERYESSEEGIRHELNAWAAAVELLDTPHQQRLMQHLIGTRQLFTLRALEGPGDEAFCCALCRWLAQHTGGIYQHDGQGFFGATGMLLAREEA